MIDLDFSLLTKIPYVKHSYCKNSRSAAKEALILLFSWNNLSIFSSKWQISWILFDLSLFVTTFKSKAKTHLLSRCFEKEELVLVYICQSSPRASFQEGKNINSCGGELRKVLRFHKSHRKASVTESLF